MRHYLDALRRIALDLGRALGRATRAAVTWLSVPFNLCLAAIGLSFVVSFAAWAVADRFETVLLYFPDSRGALRGEVREVPRGPGGEERAGLIASELLLGPKTSTLFPAFPQGVKAEAVIYRKGRLFVDISPEAALAAPESIRRGMAAMEKSLRAALPGMKRLSLTIGGKEPYSAGIKVEGGAGDAKKTGI